MFSSPSPNQSPMKFSSPDKIANLKASYAPQEYFLSQIPPFYLLIE